MAQEAEILLADDSEIGRYVIATTLRRAGFHVREVPDGIEALREIMLRPPDLAVLDVKMPGLNGIELCGRMKGDPAVKHVPVLLLSATFLDSADQVEGLDTGADAYLTQPVEAPVLIASIRSLLRTRSAERAERRVATEWQVTFDAIGDAVALVDDDGRIRRSNRAFATLVRTPTEGTVGRRLEELAPELADVLVPSVSGPPSIQIADREFICRLDDIPGVEHAPGHVLTLRDVTAERELARQRERMLQREREISGTLQQALAPGRLPSIPGLTLSAKYVLGEADVVVGGDWFDVIPTAGGVWLTMGDNAGHGVVTTARAVQLRNSLRLLADEGYEPAEAMRRLGEMLVAERTREIASAMIVALSAGGGRAEVVCAGHPPGLLIRADGGSTLIGERGGPILGIAQAEYVSMEIELRSGDTVVLYTDGVVERRGEVIDTGIERLRAAIAEVEPAQMAQRAFAELVPDSPTDDAAILVAQVTRPRGSPASSPPAGA